jgi:hypothetical protein
MQDAKPRVCARCATLRVAALLLACAAALLGALPLLLAASAWADPAADGERALLDKIERLESRVRQLEDERAADAERDPLERRIERLESNRASAPREDAWTDRIQLSGTSSFGYFDGAQDSVFPQGSFDVWDGPHRRRHARPARPGRAAAHGGAQVPDLRQRAGGRYGGGRGRNALRAPRSSANLRPARE